MGSRERIEEGELFLSALLRLGVTLSAVIILLGLALLFATQHQTGYLNRGLPGMVVYPSGAGSAPVHRSLSDIVHALPAGDPDAIIGLGLIVLIATPIMRVAASIFLFAAQRDYVYVAITLFVLIVLLISFTLGKVE